MPLEPKDQRHLTAAHGYVELGMYMDANEELEEIDAEVRHVAEVLEVRLAIYNALQKWALMETVAKRLALYDPDNAQWTISWAYATRRADCIEAARLILVNALEIHPGEAIIHYNLACYECQLGNLDVTQRRLEEAFKLDPRLRKEAMEDLDLEPLWGSLSGPLEDYRS